MLNCLIPKRNPKHKACCHFLHFLGLFPLHTAIESEFLLSTPEFECKELCK